MDKPPIGHKMPQSVIQTVSPAINRREIRVLIAEDSATIRYQLTMLINNTPGIRVVGEAKNGEEAVGMVAELKPDVVSMDINMPLLDGLEATRRIMATYPTPVVVVSGLVEKDVELSMMAIEAGALAVVEKPPDRLDMHYEAKQRQLVRTLVAMSSVSVVRRAHPRGDAPQRPITLPLIPPKVQTPEIVVIGASAGGPSALNNLLGALPADLSVPVVIVQHIPPEFMNGLSRWLGKNSRLRVTVALDNLSLHAGTVYLAPGSAHLGVARVGNGLVVRLIHEQGDYRHQPSVDALFHSVAQVCGARAVGVILTGMGDDGAQGLLALRQAGARTFAQDRTSATVFGMPGAALACGAVEKEISLAELPSAIIKSLSLS
ncbi:MAG: chemotaxis-specific protein-glutamate methyltransferase CheB [Phototrophicales bacterium]|nr:chemotaxis-specific protein-glutamate methyltransferase CheB [Phototrophicales bacterium]